jgi:hypothetical protein
VAGTSHVSLNDSSRIHVDITHISLDTTHITSEDATHISLDITHILGFRPRAKVRDIRGCPWAGAQPCIHTHTHTRTHAHAHTVTQGARQEFGGKRERERERDREGEGQVSTLLQTGICLRVCVPLCVYVGPPGREPGGPGQAGRVGQKLTHSSVRHLPLYTIAIL